MSQLLSNLLASSFAGDKGQKGEIGEKGSPGEGITLAGGNTEVLFNDSGSANGSLAFTFDKSSNTITVGGNILPSANVTYDLGTADKRFKDIYLSNSSIYLGSVTISSNDSTLVLPESTVIGDASVLSPRIANVQIANSTWSVIDDVALDTAGGYIIINGAGFNTGINVLIGDTAATSVTRVNSTQLRVQVPALTSGSYTIYASNPDGGLAIGLNAVATSNTPVWATGATLSGGLTPFSVNVALSATEASDTVTYSNVGALPTGLTLASNGLLTGTLTVVSDTTFNFVVRATDEENQDADRTFNVTIFAPVTFAGTYAGNTFNGTYGVYWSSGIKAGNNIVITAGSTASGCGSFSVAGGSTFASVVTHNKSGNVAWSKCHLQNWQLADTGQSTWFFGLNASYNLSAKRPLWALPLSPATIDSNDNIYTAMATPSYYDALNSAFILKYSSSGDIQWNLKLTNNYANSRPLPFSVEMNNDGNLFAGLYRWNNNLSDYNAGTVSSSFAASHLLVINAASGNILSQFDIGMPHTMNIKPVPNTTGKILMVGTNYGYAAIGIANTLAPNTYTDVFARRYQTSSGTAIFNDSAIHSNGAVYALGSAGNNQSLNIVGWSSPDLNNGGTYSWNTSFANTNASRGWTSGKIKLANNYLYVVATDSPIDSYSNCTGYIFRLHAGNGAIDYQKSFTANSTSTSFMANGVDVKEDKMYITGIINESNSTGGLAAKTITLVLPSNGYSNTTSSANIQYEIPGIYGNNKIVYKSSSLSVMSTNSYNFGDACSSIGYISTPSNTMVVNTTANFVVDILTSNVHYNGDTTGGYYNASKITNATSNTVMLSF